MNSSSRSVGIRLRVDIGPECSIGPGKIALLEQIERSGSLSQAARILKMSYRRAWLLLEDLNRTLGAPVTTASVGGVGGGGAQITPFGRRVAAAFRETEREATRVAAEQLEWLTHLNVESSPVAPRRAVTRALSKHNAEPSIAEPAAVGPVAVADGPAVSLPESGARPGKRVRAGKPP